ncbi:MAG: PH domain-containing protein [bacterium]|nr:PH domain-containing protein [bacterium]
MSYAHIWKKVVNSDELIVYEFSIGKGYITYNLVVWTLLSMALIFIPMATTSLADNPAMLSVSAAGFIFFLLSFFHFGFYLRIANAYAFTSKRILIHRGWFSTHTISIPYHKITDVSVTESFIERILTRTGQISINTAGTNVHEIHLRHITNPYEAKKELDKVRDRYRRLHMSGTIADHYESP